MKHSCESQLLFTIHDFSYFINNRAQVDIGILDKPSTKQLKDHFLPHARSPQESLKAKFLKPTLFLININDLVKDIQHTV